MSVSDTEAATGQAGEYPRDAGVDRAAGPTISPAAPHRVETSAAPMAAPMAAPVAEPERMGTGGFVYALGHIEARYPSLGVEKEFAQAIAQQDTTHLSDRRVIKQVISQDANRYLARSLCWLLVIQGLETYILTPRDPADFKLLIDAYREEPSSNEIDVVIGHQGPIAPADACNGLAVPIVAFDQIYSFARQDLLDAIPQPESLTEADEAQFRQASGEVFDRIMQMSDNAGAIDEHRALNYLAVRYPRLYAAAAEAFARNASVTGVEVRPSQLGGPRTIVDVIFSYTDRRTDVVDKQFARVDTTEEFPFLVTKLGPYFHS